MLRYKASQGCFAYCKTKTPLGREGVHQRGLNRGARRPLLEDLSEQNFFCCGIRTYLLLQDYRSGTVQEFSPFVALTKNGSPDFPDNKNYSSFKVNTFYRYWRNSVNGDIFICTPFSDFLSNQVTDSPSNYAKHSRNRRPRANWLRTRTCTSKNKKC